MNRTARGPTASAGNPGSQRTWPRIRTLPLTGLLSGGPLAADLTAGLSSRLARRLRSLALALLALLLVQFALGMAVNLNVHVPSGRPGYGPAAPALVLYAMVGLTLIAGSIHLAVRAAAARMRPIVAPAVTAPVVLLAAAVNGVTFLGTGANGASLAMALCAAIAIGCHGLILYLLPNPAVPSDGTLAASGAGWLSVV